MMRTFPNVDISKHVKLIVFAKKDMKQLIRKTIDQSRLFDVSIDDLFMEFMFQKFSRNPAFVDIELDLSDSVVNQLRSEVDIPP